MMLKNVIGATMMVAVMGAAPAHADNGDVVRGLIGGIVLGTIINQQQQQVDNHNHRYEQPRQYDHRPFDRRVTTVHRDIVIIEKQARSYDMCARGDGRCAGMYYDVLRGRR
jgi:hypothetical protein